MIKSGGDYGNKFYLITVWSSASELSFIQCCLCRGKFIGNGKGCKRRQTSDKDPSSFGMNSRNKYFV